MPSRAIASRSGLIVITGNPVACSTATSAAPATLLPPQHRSRPQSYQRVEVVAEDLDRKLGAHARDQFVEAHLDGLQELVSIAGYRR